MANADANARPIDDVLTMDELRATATTCTGRLATDGHTAHYPKGSRWEGDLRIERFIAPLRGMNNLQVSRRKTVTAQSMYNALRWERTASRLNDLVFFSLLGAREDFFSPLTFNDAMSTINKGEDGELSDYMTKMRLGHFVVQLFGFYNNTLWVGVIFQLAEDKSDGSLHVDRIAVLDPYLTNRADRLVQIQQVIRRICAEGDIEIDANVSWNDLAHDDIPNRDGMWPAGHVVFALVCEFFRRVKVLKHRQLLSLGGLWRPFSETYDFDTYRQRMLSACAQQAIERSRCAARLAIEVPGTRDEDPLSHNAALLMPVRPRPSPDRGAGGAGGTGQGQGSGSGTNNKNNNIAPAPGAANDDIDVVEMRDLTDVTELNNRLAPVEVVRAKRRASGMPEDGPRASKVRRVIDKVGETVRRVTPIRVAKTAALVRLTQQGKKEWNLTINKKRQS
ncbi:hypothetical protein PG993_013448 [Apiospora rasikravindrae]|uniref:Uncharacterized protein n=1 Tax=Apiospora rasikravindrae TaxID=990691 RepID=A0ABR1RXP2_9PEZI